MKFKPIIIVPGDPFSIFIEIFFKSYDMKFLDLMSMAPWAPQIIRNHKTEKLNRFLFP